MAGRHQSDTYRASVLVVATGAAGAPFRPDWLGARASGAIFAIASNTAILPLMRASGFLWSASEIPAERLRLDLAEAGTSVALAVRGPVNIVPRELLGMPILNWAIVLNRLPPRLADLLASPLIRLSLGSLPRLGLGRPAIGPFADVCERGRVPLIDTGSVAAIRRGDIAIRPDVRRLHPGKWNSSMAGESRMTRLSRPRAFAQTFAAYCPRRRNT